MNRQIQSGESYDSTRLVTRFRFWLIWVLAGRSTVVLNARLGVVDAPDGVSGVAGSFPCGALFRNVEFPENNGTQVVFTQRDRGVK